jgi:hypothetical protein
MITDDIFGISTYQRFRRKCIKHLVEVRDYKELWRNHARPLDRLRDYDKLHEKYPEP